MGVVLRSEHAAVEPGKHIYGMLRTLRGFSCLTSLIGTACSAFQEYVVFKDPSEVYWYRILENKEGLPWSAYTGICGLAGTKLISRWVFTDAGSQ